LHAVVGAQHLQIGQIGVTGADLFDGFLLQRHALLAARSAPSPTFRARPAAPPAGGETFRLLVGHVVGRGVQALLCCLQAGLGNGCDGAHAALLPK
jgi:hypothetical protein